MLAPGLIGFAERALGNQAPTWPFVLNEDSPQAEGLYAWYPVIAGGGTTLYDLNNGRHGTLTGAPAWGVSGEGRPVLTYDGGANDYVDLGDDPNMRFLSGSPWSAYIRFRQTSAGDRSLIGKWGGLGDGRQFLLRISSGVPEVFGNGSLLITGSTSVANGSRYHALVVNDGSQAAGGIKLYIADDKGRVTDNGASGTFGSDATDPTDGLALGSRGGQPGNFDDRGPFVGDIEEYRPYARALSAAEFAHIADPATRWDLYWEPDRVLYFLPVVTAGGGATRVVSLDAAVQEQKSLAASLDAGVQAGKIGLASLDGAVATINAQAASLDAAVQALATATPILDAAIQAAATRTASIDAALAAARTVAANVDGVLSAARTLTAALDAHVTLPGVSTATTSLDAAVFAVRSAGASLDAAVRIGSSVQTNLDAALAAVRTLGPTLDAAVQDGKAASARLDAHLTVAGAETRAVLLDAAIRKAFMTSLGLDAAMQMPMSASAALDAILGLLGQASASLDAVLAIAGSAALALDAALRGTVTVTTGIDGVIGVQFSPAGRRTTHAYGGRTFSVPGGGRTVTH